MQIQQQIRIILWVVATAAAIGTGWYFASLYRQWLIIGLLIGICQALVFLPNWKLAAGWLLSTSLGWVVAVFAMWALKTLVPALPYSWVTANTDDLGWAFALLPFIGVPLTSLAQSGLLARYLKSEPWIYWFGVPVCSFPMALLISFGLINPRVGSAILSSIPNLSFSFWLLGALWGLCTGWAIFKTADFRTPATITPRRSSAVYRKLSTKLYPDANPLDD